MEKAIRLAYENGWNNKMYGFDCEIDTTDHYVLDPLFWQSLGRALGWEKYHEDFCYTRTGGKCDCLPEDGWFHYALRFFELKLTGGDEGKFWEELLKGL